MMQLMKLSLALFALVTLAVGASAHVQAQGIPEAPETERRAAALEVLKKTPDAVLVYAEGLCCQSCGIGVRKKIGAIDFVDVDRFNKGVELHPRTQLATVAIKKGKEANGGALARAIDAAGYDPVNLYRLRGGELLVTSIALGN